jgi:DNA-directed RNA polymerase specialized sigma24 family protein
VLSLPFPCRESSRPESHPQVPPAFVHPLRSQAEVLRTVVEAVLALDEPYRSVVLARYFRGWEIKRIADETRVPIATIKARLS